MFPPLVLSWAIEHPARAIPMLPDSFDPYYQWLGIPPSDQPANHYHLLGISLFEDNPEVIDRATDSRLGFLRTRQGGPNSRWTQLLMKEISAARVCLLDLSAKRQYDAELQEKFALEGRSVSSPIRATVPMGGNHSPLDPLQPSAPPQSSLSTPLMTGLIVTGTIVVTAAVAVSTLFFLSPGPELSEPQLVGSNAHAATAAVTPVADTAVADSAQPRGETSIEPLPASKLEPTAETTQKSAESQNRSATRLSNARATSADATDLFGFGSVEPARASEEAASGPKSPAPPLAPLMSAPAPSRPTSTSAGTPLPSAAPSAAAVNGPVGGFAAPAAVAPTMPGGYPGAAASGSPFAGPYAAPGGMPFGGGYPPGMMPRGGFPGGMSQGFGPPGLSPLRAPGASEVRAIPFALLPTADEKSPGHEVNQLLARIHEGLEKIQTLDTDAAQKAAHANMLKEIQKDISGTTFRFHFPIEDVKKYNKDFELELGTPWEAKDIQGFHALGRFKLDGWRESRVLSIHKGDVLELSGALLVRTAYLSGASRIQVMSVYYSEGPEHMYYLYLQGFRSDIRKAAPKSE